MKTYCIFEVHDYKGGELSSQINLSKDEFISALAERFEYSDDIREDSSLEEIEEIVRTEIEDPDFEAEYAGWDGFCGELYEVKDGKLKETSYSKYIKDIAKHIKNNWDY